MLLLNTEISLVKANLKNDSITQSTNGAAKIHSQEQSASSCH
jgi:hypothetical protein